MKPIFTAIAVAGALALIIPFASGCFGLSRQGPTTEAGKRFCRGFKLSLTDEAIQEYSLAIELSTKCGRTFGAKLDTPRPVPRRMSLYGAGRIDATAHNNRGVVYIKRKEYDKAMADFSAAIRIDPGFSLAYENRALAHIKRKEYDKAIADFDTVIRFAPDYVSSEYQSEYEGRAMANWLAGSTSEAQRDFEYAKRLGTGYNSIERLVEHQRTRLGGVSRGGPRGNLCPDTY